MPKPLSADIRDRFRRLFEGGLSGREAARRLLISAATGSRLARRLKRGASLQPAPNPRKSGRGKLAPWHDFLIEQAFSKLKAHLRRIGARSFTQLFKAIGEICEMFSPQECWNYLHAAGYVSI